jgi:phage FluMu protein Com
VSKKNKDIRCAKCNKKIAEAEIKEGYVSIKCSCGVTNLITVTPEKKEREQAAPEKREYPRGTPHY